MSALFGNKNIKDIFFGNKAITAIYRGSTLVWQRIKKILIGWYDTNNYCFEYIPDHDITLSDISVLGQYYGTGGICRVINECGLCMVYKNGCGVEGDVTIYTLTGNLRTFSSLGTVTLYANNKYYISFRGNNDGMYVAKYQGLTGNYKSFSNLDNWNSTYSGAATHRCEGSATTFEEICQKHSNCYFIWRGQLNNPGSMVPNDNGTANPYTFLLNRDMSKVKHLFTDGEFNNVPVGSYNDDMARYAYIYYIMGSTEGDEFIMNTNYWNQGFNIGGTTVFNNNQNKIYKLSGNMSKNHITSMTPITTEPTTRNLGDVYYKGDVSWSSGPTGRAVVAWNGSAWEYATGISTEWTEDSQYNATNYCTKIDDYRVTDFNRLSVQSGDKFYLQINGGEI